MTTPLSSLLVRDGLVAVERIVRALEHQVVRGGTLDTALLELNAIPFERMHEYLSLASGLPTIDPWQIEGIENSAVERCPKELATRYHVVPIGWDRNALRVLVCDPVDLEQLEHLANELGVALQPTVVPEYQFLAGAAQIFGDSLENRYQELSEAAKSAPSATPADLPRMVINGANDKTSAPVEIEPEPTQPQEPPEERVRGKRPKPEQPERKSQEIEAARKTQQFTTEALEQHRREVEEQAEAKSAALAEVPAEETQSAPPEQTQKAPEEQSEETIAILDPSPMAPTEVRLALAQTEERKEIFHLFLRGMRFRSQWAGLFVVRKNKLHGRRALFRETIETDEIANLELDLTTASPFKTVLDSKSFFIGAPALDSPLVQALLDELGGGSSPATLLVVPILLQNRVAAMGVAHRFEHEFTVGDVSELLPLANVTAEAMSRLIVSAKTDQHRSDKGPSDAETKTVRAPTVEQQGAADPKLTQLFDTIEGDDIDAAKRAMQEAVELGDAALDFILGHFPGKVANERDAGGKPESVASLGPTLETVLMFGEQAGSLLAELMGATEKDTRYYATLCAAELLPEEALDPMVERLLDKDPDIRAIATDGLRKYPSEKREKALALARRVLHSEDVDRLRAAADALARVSDFSAIPDLLDVHSRGGDAATSSRSALILLTCQDFGTSNRKWRNWWNKSKEQTPIEWMLDGLGHKNADVRKSAADSLRTLTGEYFGYHHDLPKKEREQSRKRWLEWWSRSEKK